MSNIVSIIQNVKILLEYISSLALVDIIHMGRAIVLLMKVIYICKQQYLFGKFFQPLKQVAILIQEEVKGAFWNTTSIWELITILWLIILCMSSSLICKITQVVLIIFTMFSTLICLKDQRMIITLVEHN